MGYIGDECLAMMLGAFGELGDGLRYVYGVVVGEHVGHGIIDHVCGQLWLGHEHQLPTGDLRQTYRFGRNVHTTVISVQSAPSARTIVT